MHETRTDGILGTRVSSTFVREMTRVPRVPQSGARAFFRVRGEGYTHKASRGVLSRAGPHTFNSENILNTETENRPLSPFRKLMK